MERGIAQDEAGGAFEDAGPAEERGDLGEFTADGERMFAIIQNARGLGNEAFHGELRLD